MPEKDPKPEIRRLRRSYRLGLQIIVSALGISAYIGEVGRVMSQSRNLTGFLYLGLLTATVLLIFGWLVASWKELQMLERWLVVADYTARRDPALVLAFAVVLIGLFFAAREARVFGIIYTVYAAMNLLATVHYRDGISFALYETRKHLDAATTADPRNREAIDMLWRHFVTRPNIARTAGTFACGIVGSALAIEGSRLHDVRLQTAAYSLFIASIIVLEGIVILAWRIPLYLQLSKLEQATGAPSTTAK